MYYYKTFSETILIFEVKETFWRLIFQKNIMAFRVLFILAILKIYHVFGYEYNVCDFDCSYSSTGKPCKNTDSSNKTCVDYDDIYGKICPNGYQDCSGYSDACNKECNTIYGPCMSLYSYDDSCYEYVQGFGCPFATKDCSGFHIPCEYCTKDAPCLTDDYIYGDYTCYPEIYLNDVKACPRYTTKCDVGVIKPVCSKKCNIKSRGKPCMDNYPIDNHCWDYDSRGNCPMDTTDCGAIKV